MAVCGRDGWVYQGGHWVARKAGVSPLCLCKVAPVAQMPFYSCGLRLLSVADALLREGLLFGQALSKTRGRVGPEPGTVEISDSWSLLSFLLGGFLLIWSAIYILKILFSFSSNVKNILPSVVFAF